MRPSVAIAIAVGLALDPLLASATPQTPASSHGSMAPSPLSSNQARAETPPASESPAKASPRTASELYAAAEERYAAGDLPAALTYMQACYDTTQNPKLLFNLADLHRELSHCQEAVALYQRYLDTASHGSKRALASERIAALSQNCPPLAAKTSSDPIPHPIPTASSEKPTQVQPAPPPQTHRWRTIGWVAAATGAVTATATVYFAVKTKQASSDIAEWNAATHPKGLEYSSTGIEERRTDFARNQAIAITCGILTAVAAGTVVSAFAVGVPNEARAAASRFHALVLPDAVWIDYTKRF